MVRWSPDQGESNDGVVSPIDGGRATTMMARKHWGTVNLPTKLNPNSML